MTEVKAAVMFRAINLLESYSMIGNPDVIFCRNVLIYFSSDLKKAILTKMHAQLKAWWLFGVWVHPSHCRGLSDKFEMIHCHPGILYRAKVEFFCNNSFQE